MAGRTPQGNDDFAWTRFDPDAYVAHYYADPHPDDDAVVRHTCAALANAGRRDLETLDVGTGPNLFPLFAALPVAQRLTVWEYAPSNIDWIQRELAGGVLRPPWTHFWNIARAAHEADGVDNPIAALRDKTDIVQGSIFDLPERRWDAATMFFCAESITEQQDEFERACAAFARAVRPGGVLAGAFLAGSRGYRVGEEDFPAVSVTPDSLSRAFAGLAHDIVTTPIGAMADEIRSGYSGMIFLSARAF
jgi:NNMT/PNMT/TEMT family